jgi:hypothetical protein
MPTESPQNKRIPAFIAALALAVVGVAVYVVFELFDLDYLDWYVSAGPLIQFVVAGLAIAVDLERHPRLISADPGEFLAEAQELAGVTFLSFSDDLRPGRGRSRDEELPKPGWFDPLFGVGFYATYFAVILAWCVVIAPLQYLGNLVAGAPARLALASTTRTRANRQGNSIVLERSRVDKLPDGAEEIGLAHRPVTATALISAGLLYALGAV